jgi:energy-converting hydrogenase Eha subunit B
MIKKLKLYALSMISILGLLAPMAITATVSAQATITPQSLQGNLCQGSNGNLSGSASAPDASCGDNATSTANNLVSIIINIISVIVGVVAVIMIIYAGFRYVTSGGSDDSVKTAKNTILYAIIGLVIVALAQIIVHFVLAKTSQASNT